KKESTVQETPKPAPPQTKGVAITDPNDVNLNVNWKWYDPTVHYATLYYGLKVDNQPVPGVQASLPWFSAGNPVNDVTKDYLPEQGWTLYLKDFGTPARPAETPFFALYNKYSGVLRFFVFNSRVRSGIETSKTYYVGELGFKNSSNYNEMLSFFAPPEKSSMQSIDPTLKQIVVTKKSSSDPWINLDFTLNIRPYNYFNANEAEATKKILLLNVYGANQSDFNLGSDFNELSAKSSVGAAGNSASGFANFVKNGYEYISSGTSLIESIDKLDGKINPSPSSQTQSEAQVAPQSIIGTVAAAVGVVKNVFGFVKSFFGGSKSATNTQTTLQYSGIVNTTGTATTTNNLYSVEFNPNYTSALSPSYYVPLYKNPIGIFMFPMAGNPVEIEQRSYNSCNLQIYQPYGGAFTTVRTIMADDLFDNTYQSIFYNNSSVKLDSIKVALMNNGAVDNSANSFESLSPQLASFNYNTTNTGSRYFNKWGIFYPYQTGENESLGYMYFHKNVRPYADANDLKIPRYIGVEIKYTVTASGYPNNDSKERIIYKIFKVPYIFSRNDTQSGCPLRPSGL
ncbi:MAG TPA: hypothetical protein VN040_26935, partial [Pseudosphingobacterium sp.]|nr:hypothetical protein [Pseudosphingobacterium sp.]